MVVEGTQAASILGAGGGSGSSMARCRTNLRPGGVPRHGPVVFFFVIGSVIFANSAKPDIYTVAPIAPKTGFRRSEPPHSFFTFDATHLSISALILSTFTHRASFFLLDPW